ncbi:hypothetical protein IWX47DRAFT_358918 [Phyllosticta citricarpa]
MSIVSSRSLSPLHRRPPSIADLSSLIRHPLSIIDSSSPLGHLLCPTAVPCCFLATWPVNPVFRSPLARHHLSRSRHIAVAAASHSAPSIPPSDRFPTFAVNNRPSCTSPSSLHMTVVAADGTSWRHELLKLVCGWATLLQCHRRRRSSSTILQIRPLLSSVFPDPVAVYCVSCTLPSPPSGWHASTNPTVRPRHLVRSTLAIASSRSLSLQAVARHGA